MLRGSAWVWCVRVCGFGEKTWASCKGGLHSACWALTLYSEAPFTSALLTILKFDVFT